MLRNALAACDLDDAQLNPLRTSWINDMKEHARRVCAIYLLGSGEFKLVAPKVRTVALRWDFQIRAIKPRDYLDAPQ